MRFPQLSISWCVLAAVFKILNQTGAEHFPAQPTTKISIGSFITTLQLKCATRISTKIRLLAYHGLYFQADAVACIGSESISLCYYFNESFECSPTWPSLNICIYT